MKKTYWLATFIPVREGGYAVFFADFPECASQGGDLAEAMDMAAESLADVLEDYRAEGRPVPAPSPLDAVRGRMAERYRELADAPLPDGTLHPPIAAPLPRDTRIVRPSISLQKADLDAIDAKAKRLGMSRSRLIVQATLAY